MTPTSTSTTPGNSTMKRQRHPPPLPPPPRPLASRPESRCFRWQLVGWPVRPVEPCLAPARLLLCVVPPPATSTTTISGWRRHRDSRRLFARRSTPTTFLGGLRDTREIRLSLFRDGSSRRPRYSNGTAICSGWNNPTPGGRICSCHLLDQIMVLDDESCQQPTHRIRLRTDHMNRFPSPYRHRNLCRFPSGS